MATLRRASGLAILILLLLSPKLHSQARLFDSRLPDDRLRKLTPLEASLSSSTRGIMTDLPAVCKTSGGGSWLRGVTVMERWDTSALTWNPEAKDSNAYDGTGNHIFQVGWYWIGDEWVPNTRYYNSYDVGGNCTGQLCQVWRNSDWTNYTDEISSYDGGGLHVEDFSRVWNGVDYYDASRIFYSYDEGKHLTEALRQSRYPFSDWHDNTRETYAYDAEGHQTEWLLEGWTGSAWKGLVHRLWTYDAEGRKSSAVFIDWQEIGLTHSGRFHYTYDDEGRMVSDRFEGWSDAQGEWVDISRTSRSYDGSGNTILITGEQWDGGQWNNYYQVELTYDESGNETGFSNRYWVDGAWRDYTRTSITWQSVPTVSSLVQEDWNMISVPLVVDDFQRTALYPNATSSAYAFEGSYVQSATLENGKAYWLKFPAAQVVPLGGAERTADTVDVAAGWNLIGALSAPVDAANIGSMPGGIVTGEFFAYDGPYHPSTTLEPGHGYWVKASIGGQLVLNSTVSMPASSRITIARTDELPPPPPGSGLRYSPPARFALGQNFPNPFNPVTRISYALPSSSFVTVKIYNVLGEEVATLVNEMQDAGPREVSFSAVHLASGVYMYRITAGPFTEIKKMVLLK